MATLQQVGSQLLIITGFSGYCCNYAWHLPLIVWGQDDEIDWEEEVNLGLLDCNGSANQHAVVCLVHKQKQQWINPHVKTSVSSWHIRRTQQHFHEHKFRWTKDLPTSQKDEQKVGQGETYVSITVQHRKKVIFTDESKFQFARQGDDKNQSSPHLTFWRQGFSNPQQFYNWCWPKCKAVMKGSDH